MSGRLVNEIMLIAIIMIVGSSMMININGQDFLELPSRDEMVKMAGYGEDKLSTVLITGMIFCNTCLHNQLIHSKPVSGSSVAVTCKTKNNADKKRQMRGAKAVSDNHGEFTIDLPSELHATRNLEKVCSVKVLHLPKDSPCHNHQSRKHNKITLLSVENGVRTYAAGAIMTFHGSAPKNSKACV